LQDQVYFRDFKAGDGDIQVVVDAQQVLQFDRKDRLVPAAFSASRLSAIT
jgi:hypothetical protein